MTARFLLDIFRRSPSAIRQPPGIASRSTSRRTRRSLRCRREQAGRAHEGFVIRDIKKAIREDLISIKRDIEDVQAQRAIEKKDKGPSLSEMKALEADAFLANQLDAKLATLTEEQKAQIEENLRGLAVGLARENETAEEALQRIKASRYIIHFNHHKLLPFYDVEHKFGRVILTVNTAHPFYSSSMSPSWHMESKASTRKPPR